MSLDGLELTHREHQGAFRQPQLAAIRRVLRREAHAVGDATDPAEREPGRDFLAPGGLGVDDHPVGTAVAPARHPPPEGPEHRLVRASLRDHDGGHPGQPPGGDAEQVGQEEEAVEHVWPASTQVAVEPENHTQVPPAGAVESGDRNACLREWVRKVVPGLEEQDLDGVAADAQGQSQLDKLGLGTGPGQIVDQQAEAPVSVGQVRLVNASIVTVVALAPCPARPIPRIQPLIWGRVLARSNGSS